MHQHVTPARIRNSSIFLKLFIRNQVKYVSSRSLGFSFLERLTQSQLSARRRGCAPSPLDQLGKTTVGRPNKHQMSKTVTQNPQLQRE